MVRQDVSKVQGVNLIGALPNIAKQAFNGIGATNVAMHDLWKGIKRQKMVFIFTQATDRFWIAEAIFAECSLPIG